MSQTLSPAVAAPSPARIFQMLLAIARLLHVKCCWLAGGRYHFVIRDEWTIAITPESAGRFRVESCAYGRPVAAWWALQGETDRLAGVVLDLAAQIKSGVAPGGDGGGAGEQLSM